MSDWTYWYTGGQAAPGAVALCPEEDHYEMIFGWVYYSGTILPYFLRGAAARMIKNGELRQFLLILKKVPPADDLTSVPVYRMFSVNEPQANQLRSVASTDFARHDRIAHLAEVCQIAKFLETYHEKILRESQAPTLPSLPDSAIKRVIPTRVLEGTDSTPVIAESQESPDYHELLEAVQKLSLSDSENAEGTTDGPKAESFPIWTWPPQDNFECPPDALWGNLTDPNDLIDLQLRIAERTCKKSSQTLELPQVSEPSESEQAPEGKPLLQLSLLPSAPQLPPLAQMPQEAQWPESLESEQSEEPEQSEESESAHKLPALLELLEMLQLKLTPQVASLAQMPQVTPSLQNLDSSEEEKSEEDAADQDD